MKVKLIQNPKPKYHGSLTKKFSSFKNLEFSKRTNPKGNEIRINPKNTGIVDWIGRFSSRR